MKVLLDECVNPRLAHEIAGHEVKMVRVLGWTWIANSPLLALLSVSVRK